MSPRKSTLLRRRVREPAAARICRSQTSLPGPTHRTSLSCTAMKRPARSPSPAARTGVRHSPPSPNQGGGRYFIYRPPPSSPGRRHAAATLHEMARRSAAASRASIEPPYGLSIIHMSPPASTGQGHGEQWAANDRSEPMPGRRHGACL
jgi:hypothetical protein